MRPSRAAHHCRRCRLKLAQPTENPRSAFCCRGCHRQFYETRCLACEREMERKTGNKRLCGRRHCCSKFRELKRHHLLGRYQAPRRVNSASGTPIKIGVCEGSQKRPTYRIVSGSLTPEQLRLATIGAAFGACPLDSDRKLSRKHFLEAERKETEANGDYEDTEWSELTSSDGVRCFVTPVGEGVNA
jgi:hypothetical protein